MSEHMGRTSPKLFAGMSYDGASRDYILHITVPPGSVDTSWVQAEVDRARSIAHPTFETPPDPADSAQVTKGGSPASAAPTGFPSEAPGRLRVKQERFSYADLTAEVDYLTKDLFHESITESWLNSDTNSVDVTTDRAAGSAEEGALAKRAGAGRPTVRLHNGTGHRPTESYSRWMDTAPHFGGEQIRNTVNGGTCTGGPIVWDRNPAVYGHRYQITAFHCGITGSFYNQNGASPSNVGYVHYSTSYYDTSLLDGSSYGTLYYNDCKYCATSTMDPVSWTNATSLVCGDGSVSGYSSAPSGTCGSRDPYWPPAPQTAPGCATYTSGYTACGLYAATSIVGGYDMWTSGDSGAPVILWNGNGWYVAGMVDGANHDFGRYYYVDIFTQLSWCYCALA